MDVVGGRRMEKEGSKNNNHSNRQKTTTQHDDDTWIPNRYANHLSDKTTPKRRPCWQGWAPAASDGGGYGGELQRTYPTWPTTAAASGGGGAERMMIIDNLLPFQGEKPAHTFLTQALLLLLFLQRG